jgi:hypothetical protein
MCLKLLRANSDGFRLVSEEFGGQLEVVGHFHSGYPGLVFRRGQVAAMAEFHLEVDFDSYYIYSDRREDTD